MEENTKQFILSLLVRNEAGVLTRVAGLFARRGYNIDSLTVGETGRENTSRMTVAATGDDYFREQIIKQLEKLHDVLVIEEMDMDNVVMRELMLIKVQVTQEERAGILDAVSIFRAKVVDLTPASLTVEITGERGKCDAFVEYLKPYGVTELCRTGLTAVTRGAETIYSNLK